MNAAYVKGDTEGDSTLGEELHEGQYQVVFFSPETLLREEMWRDMLQSEIYQDNVVAFVVDEAHCVKKW